MERREMTELRLMLFLCFSVLMAACGGDGVNGGGSGGFAGGTGGAVGNLSIQGSIATPTFAFVDGDTNDPNNPRQDNNFVGEADVQPLGNPGVLGGYLGSIDGSADVDDWYFVSLAAGQGATLFIPNPMNTDFDLYLFNDAGEQVANSINTGDLDWVQAVSGGDHFLLVTACLDDACSTGGPGLYNLTVGTVSISSTVEGQLSSSHDFVEGDVLISEGDDTRLPKARLPGDWRRLNERLDVKLERRAPVVGRWKVRRRSSASNVAPVVRSPLAKAIQWSPTIAAVKALRRSGTTTASPNYILRATAAPNDEFYPFQWHYPLIGLEEAWDVTEGEGVTVAVLDTGIVSRHPDFAGKIVAGFDFISDPQSARDGDGVDPDPEDPGDLGENGSGSSFHGTHVAGTIAATSNDGQGVAGVAGRASIMPMRVLGVGGGTSFDICQAMLFAAGEPNAANNGASPPADVLNMSLGGGPIDQCAVDAIAAARAKGIFVVVAAGNDNKNSDNISLAGIPDAFTVSAVDINKEKAFYSNFGDRVDVAAPGGDLRVDLNSDGYADGVLSTLANDNGELLYGFQNGTSMAAPHFAGVVALMKSANPN
ncbi:MAG: S8 family serine peptidase, partial [Deltaproteobacteria bacterium]|nr:S8 family serine peptidase [Deltaproteobacteria bacterium]